MKIDFKMSNYPGLNLSNEIRESMSLDEDDMSDVEDEVFIRDGKNSFKTAEEIYAKRPLMAPRRRNVRNNFTKMKNKPPCKAFCKPCCYFLASLSVLLGLIVVVIILVSIFPLPLDRIHDWIVSKFVSKDANSVKILPCDSYKVTDVWAVNLPKLTTDSPLYLLDINGDGVEDVLFGFATGENYGILPAQLFCTIFMGVPAPCEGGLMAINGGSGDILWRHWTNDTIFFIHCSDDLNGDKLNDCLIFGTKGTISVINTRNGTALWTLYNSDEEITMGNFISDQNNDTIPDILASHTNLLGNEGHIVLISGKDGKILKKIGLGVKTFYTPQILDSKLGKFVVFGSGGPSSAGNLSVAPFEQFFKGSNLNEIVKTLYKDLNKGMLIQSIFVDITGDSAPDIITAMYNSTVVAFDGVSFEKIWSFTLKNSQTDTVPIPGYFNFDNVTDFLIVYETYDEILHLNFTQTYILNGKNGVPIYEKPISDSVNNQIGGISVSTETKGYDLYVFPTSECKNIDVFNKIDFPVRGINVHPLYENCRHKENTTVILKLNILNQFDQPPGVEVYNSLNRTLLEFNSTKSPMQILQEHFTNRDIKGQAELGEGYDNNKSGEIGIHKYGNSNFRHKDNRNGLLKNFENYPEMEQAPYYTELEYNNGEEEEEATAALAPRSKLRDPRFSTQNLTESHEQFTTTESIYDYKNIKLAKNRLLHDLSNSPDEILSETFYKNLESRLRSSKFEQRDLSGHSNKQNEDESIAKLIEERKKSSNPNSEMYNLWNMESEKEEKDSSYWKGSNSRKKRQQMATAFNGSLRKMISIGSIADSNYSNSVDLIFLTFWQPLKYEPRKNLEEELAECVEQKLSLKNANAERIFYLNECVKEQDELKAQFPYFNDIYKLNFGQMTVYRLRIECRCNLTMRKNEKCAKFLPKSEQNWPSYLGRNGNGVFSRRP